MKLGFERTKTSPWMSNIFEKHNKYIILWVGGISGRKVNI
jgi:hypothetical protein